MENFLLLLSCYPHTLTEFASHQKTLPKIAKKYIDFSSKKLEVYLKKKIIKRILNFKNFLKFREYDDLLNFYRSTVFYNKKSEDSLKKIFLKKKKELDILILSNPQNYIYLKLN